MTTHRRSRLALCALVFGFLAGAAQAAPAIQQMYSTGQEPIHGQAGAPVVIFASGLAAPVSVFFSNGATPSVAATPVSVDLTRGIIAVRIPAGAATGTMKVRANGVDSPLYYFRIDPGTFAQGTDVLTGQVTSGGGGGGVNNAFIVLIKGGDCDSSSVWDYTTTGAAGNYTVYGTDGDYYFFVMPPVSAALAGASGGATLGASPVTQDFPLAPGTLVTGRVVDAASPSTGVASARVEMESEGFESVLTDASGNFSARLAPGAYDVSVTPPTSAAFAFTRGQIAVEASSPQPLGNVGLAGGVAISGTVTRASDVTPIPGAEVEAMTTGNECCTNVDRKAVRGDGSYTLVVPPNQTYRVQVRFGDDSGLSDVADESVVVGSSSTTLDFEAQGAALITGTVTELTEAPAGSPATPLGGINVQAETSSGPSIGSPAGSSRSCVDGSYVLRVPPDAEGYLVHAGMAEDSGYAAAVWNNTPNGSFFRCEGVRVPAPSAGGTTSGVDFRLPQGVSISGRVATQNGGCTDSSGGLVEVDDGQTHDCSAGAYDYNAQGGGTYRIYGLPPSTVVGSLRACVRQQGYDSQCWNLKTPPAFDPIVLAPGASQANTNFCLANCQQATWYHDADGDGFGNPNDTQSACGQPDGYLDSAGDCNDTSASINPDATEICGNGTDEDCDSSVDEPECQGACADADSDAYAVCSGNCAAPLGAQCGDCNDASASVHPGVTDATCNAVDENCSGVADEGFASQPTSCGVGACARTGATSCSAGVVSNGCVPGAPGPSDTTCNGTDENCSGLADEQYGSQQTTCGVGVCASMGATSCAAGAVLDSCAPGAAATELCDGADNDCDGSADEPCPIPQLPADAVVFDVLSLPGTFTWTLGEQTVFQVQIATTNAPFTTVRVNKQSFKPIASWTPSKLVWKKLKELGAGGAPLYWRVVGKPTKKSATQVVGEVRTFSFSAPVSAAAHASPAPTSPAPTSTAPASAAHASAAP